MSDDIVLFPNVRPMMPAESDIEALARRTAVADQLQYLADMIRDNNLVIDPKGVVVGFVAENGDEPQIGCYGRMTWDEIHEVDMTINDHWRERYHREAYKQRVSTVARLRRYEAERTQEAAVYLDEHPWLCEHHGCSRRFKSEKAAKVHERTCWRKQADPGCVL